MKAASHSILHEVVLTNVFRFERRRFFAAAHRSARTRAVRSKPGLGPTPILHYGDQLAEIGLTQNPQWVARRDQLFGLAVLRALRVTGQLAHVLIAYDE
jgi:hypothetical protein